MKILKAVGLVLLVAAIGGCTSGQQEGTHTSVMKHITLEDGRVGANSVDGRTAWIDASGELEIDGAPLALTPDQRVMTRQYHASAFALREQGLAIGKSGAQIAGTALGSVIEEMRAGDPDKIGSKVEAEAKAIEAQASQLCSLIGELQGTQDGLAASVPEFAPYATITDKIASDCRGTQVVKT